jgi:hypothetical protein
MVAITNVVIVEAVTKEQIQTFASKTKVTYPVHRFQGFCMGNEFVAKLVTIVGSKFTKRYFRQVIPYS